MVSRKVKERHLNHCGIEKELELPLETVRNNPKKAR